MNISSDKVLIRSHFTAPPKAILWNDGSFPTSSLNLPDGVYLPSHEDLERALYRRENRVGTDNDIPHWSTCAKIETARGTAVVFPGDWLVSDLTRTLDVPYRWTVMTPMQYMRYQETVFLMEDLLQASVSEIPDLIERLAVLTDLSSDYEPTKCSGSCEGVMFPIEASTYIRCEAGTLEITGIPRARCCLCRTPVTLSYQQRAGQRIVEKFKQENLDDGRLIVRPTSVVRREYET